MLALIIELLYTCIHQHIEMGTVQDAVEVECSIELPAVGYLDEYFEEFSMTILWICNVSNGDAISQSVYELSGTYNTNGTLVIHHYQNVTCNRPIIMTISSNNKTCTV